MASQSSTPSPRRRWLSFSLRGALLLLTAFCIWLAILATRARNQAEAVRKVAALGGTLRFDESADQHRAPEWLRQLLGEEYFRKVVAVDFPWGGVGKVGDDELAFLADLPDLTVLNLGNNKTITDAGLQHLASLRKLRQVYLHSKNISGAGLQYLPRDLETLNLTSTSIDSAAHLQRMDKLKHLHLSGATITDEGLAGLSGLSALEDLRLSNTGLTDAGLEHLRPLQNLKLLCIPGTKVTSQGIVRLQEALPNCHVYPPADSLRPTAPSNEL